MTAVTVTIQLKGLLDYVLLLVDESRIVLVALLCEDNLEDSLSATIGLVGGHNLNAVDTIGVQVVYGHNLTDRLSEYLPQYPLA